MNKIRICLDAGHVGSRYNQSPVVKTYYESAAMWSLHLKLKTALEALGFEVVTTRASIDTKMDVYDRGAASQGVRRISVPALQRLRDRERGLPGGVPGL